MEDPKSPPVEDTPSVVSGSTGYTTEVVSYKIGKIKSYEVTETELSILEDGDDGGIYLNIAIAFLSTSASFLISLVTCDFKSDTTKGMFIAASLLLFLFGFIFTIMYYRLNRKTKELYRKIKNREIL